MEIGSQKQVCHRNYPFLCDSLRDDEDAPVLSTASATTWWLVSTVLHWVDRNNRVDYDCRHYSNPWLKCLTANRYWLVNPFFCEEFSNMKNCQHMSHWHSCLTASLDSYSAYIYCCCSCEAETGEVPCYIKCGMASRLVLDYALLRESRHLLEVIVWCYGGNTWLLFKDKPGHPTLMYLIGGCATKVIITKLDTVTNNIRHRHILTINRNRGAFTKKV